MSAYTEPLPDYGHLMTIVEFASSVRTACLIDYDGFGHPVRDGLMDESKNIYPSQIAKLPKSATHVMWFNR